MKWRLPAWWLFLGGLGVYVIAGMTLSATSNDAITSVVFLVAWVAGMTASVGIVTLLIRAVRIGWALVSGGSDGVDTLLDRWRRPTA